MKQFILGAAALGLVACSANQAAHQQPFDGMTLNLETMQVVTPSWTSPLIDCSDALVECLEAPGYFLVSMQRNCAREVAWEAGGHPYRTVGIAPHYGLPSANYMSTKYPHVHWQFGAPVERGFTRWARTLVTPRDAGWGTNAAVEEYQVRIIGPDPWFRCA